MNPGFSGVFQVGSVLYCGDSEQHVVSITTRLEEMASIVQHALNHHKVPCSTWEMDHTRRSGLFVLQCCIVHIVIVCHDLCVCLWNMRLMRLQLFSKVPLIFGTMHAWRRLYSTSKHAQCWLFQHHGLLTSNS